MHSPDPLAIVAQSQRRQADDINILKMNLRSHLQNYNSHMQNYSKLLPLVEQLVKMTANIDTRLTALELRLGSPGDSK